MLTCPRCSEKLRSARGSGGISWLCPSCRGRATTLPVLRKLAPKSFVRDLWRASGNEPASPGLKCPSCHHPSRAVDVALVDGVETLDVCRRCHVIWFDAGEFAAVPRSPPPLPEAPAGRSKALSPEATRARVAFEVERAESLRRARPPPSRTMGGLAQPEGMWKYLPGLLGMPVEFDDLPPSRAPWTTWSMLAVVALMGIYSLADPATARGAAGFLPSDPWRSLGLTWLTCFFVHAGVLHLLGNLYFLWIFGDNVEDRLGSTRFLLLLALATIGGNAMHMLVTDTPNLPLVGASGGISGIVVYYALLYPRVRIGLLFLFVLWLRLPAIGWLALWALLQLLGVTLLEGSNVAYGAHLGGALVGLVAWLSNRFLLRQHVQRTVARTVRKGGYA